MNAREYINVAGGDFLNSSPKVNRARATDRNRTSFNMNNLRKLAVQDRGLYNLKRNLKQLRLHASNNNTNTSQRQGVLVAGKGLKRGTWVGHKNKAHVTFNTNNNSRFVINPKSLMAVHINRNNRISRPFKLGYSSYINFK